MSLAMPAPALPLPWRQALPALVLALAAVLLLYAGTFAAMVSIWARSDTFAHAFLVPPISLWLVWRQRETLRALRPRPQPWTLLPVALIAAAWLVGDIAGVNALTQLSVTTILVLAVPALLGWAVARAIAFPLAFLLFMVPIGDFVMPTLMQWTADVTVVSLKALGIPVYQEGLKFVIPSGTWSVIEACSGVRYLIASFMVGTLFAYLQYRSTSRRIAFGMASLLVPVVANWARAVMIVVLGHLSDNRIAAGVDHLIYGWIFFGIVVAGMFFVGARWAEPAQAPGAVAVESGGPGSAAVHWAVAAALVLIVAAPQAALHRRGDATPPMPAIELPALAAATPSAATPRFEPTFGGAAAETARVYGEGEAAITVHVAYYRHQTYGHKLVSSDNVLVTSHDDKWRQVAQGRREVATGTRTLELRSAELRGDAIDRSQSELPLQVRQLYWVDGRLTTRDTAAAVYAVIGELAGRGDDAAAITFAMAGADPELTGAALERFAALHIDELTRWLDTLRSAR